MKDLIPINTDDGIRTANARDIHRFVESKQHFTDWIQNRIEKCGFQEGIDFIVHKIMTQYNQIDRVEYFVTLDMGKELGMLEQNEKGSEIRQYFIRKEKESSQQALIIATLKNEIIGEIKSEFQKLAKDFVRSDLTALDVRKADETVHSMGYDKISHGEKVVIMSAIRDKARVGGMHSPERYGELRNVIFNAYGVSRFVQIRKADSNKILRDVASFDFKNKQLSIYSHLKVVQ